jgi:Cu(I)/Ag(I) efflux system membrane fusion protein
MRKNYIVKCVKQIKPRFCGLAAVLMTGVLLLSSCSGKRENKHDDPGTVNIDSNLAHLLKPSNEQVVSTLPLIKAEYGTKIFTEEAQGMVSYDTRNEKSIASRVSGRIERLLVKYSYQPVKKGQLIMEVYSPDLAAAQQELLFLKQSETNTSLLNSAKQRLMLLGMSASTINQVLKTGRVNYRIPVYSNADGYILEKSAPAPVTASVAEPSLGSDGMSGMGAGGASGSSTVPVPVAPASSPIMLREGQYVSAGQSLFIIYNSDRLVAEFSLKPALAALLKKGHRFMFYKTSEKGSMETGSIGLIQPVFKDGENFTIARVYLHKPNFRVGELLTAKIPVLLPKSWWLPEAAVVSLGNKSIVFKKEGNVFVPKEVDAGFHIAGMVQVKTNVSDWALSKNAAYLVDSESFIKISE